MKYHVERSIHIDAPKATVMPFIQDFSHWNSWSPWTIAEPGCPVTVTGSPDQPGHAMEWDGQIIGSGKNVLAAFSDSTLNYDLYFFKPFKSQAKTGFQLREQDGGTKVIWTMDASMPFFMFFMVPTMKTMISMDYDRGLRMLKEIVEKGDVKASTEKAGLVNLDGFSYVGIKNTASIDDIGTPMSRDFDSLKQDFVQKNNLEPDQWVSLYPKMDMKNMQMTYIVAISDEGLGNVSIPPNFVRGTVNSGRAFEVKHDGSYDFIGNAWSMGMMHLRAKKIKQKGVPYEKYWNHPGDVAEDDLKTSIYFPVKG